MMMKRYRLPVSVACDCHYEDDDDHRSDVHIGAQ